MLAAGAKVRLAGYRTVRFWAAFVWRCLLIRTTFIAITGSVGKTTAKECLAAILSQRQPTAKNFANQNDQWGVPHTVLRVRPWHRFAVIEISGGTPGLVRKLGRLVRPDVAVILAVKQVHRKALRTLEAVAAEKASLLSALRPGGIAVLNAGDPLVASMPAPPGVAVRWFGGPSACRASDVSSQWPARLSFRLTVEGRSERLQTKLVGPQWIPSLLGAISAAIACGADLPAILTAVENLEPFTGRMQPVYLPSGAVMIRDEKDGQLPTLEAAAEVLRTAQAGRRVLIVSDFSDTPKNHRDRMRHLGKLAARSADLAIFIDAGGEDAARAAVQAGMRPENVHCFVDLRRAAEFVRHELGPGDLALLKGRVSHHLTRLYYAQLGTVGCARTTCGILFLCDLCPKLRPGLEYVPPGAVKDMAPLSWSGKTRSTSPGERSAS
jgi:UDP-N-acetylmuramoyl-tripeptide--D-alanyl-D-alanine ligase